MATPIGQVGSQTLFPMLTALERAGADEDFVVWARKPANAKDLMEWYFSQEGVIAPGDLVTVPNVKSAELLALARSVLDLDDVCSMLEGFDFMRGDGGKTFETMTLNVKGETDKRFIRSPEFPAGYVGSVAAYITWLMQTKAKDVYLAQQRDNALMINNGIWYPTYEFRYGKGRFDLSEHYWQRCHERYIAFKPK